MKKINLLLIGFGLHSQKIYFPICEHFSCSMGFRLTAFIDLEEKEQDIKNYLSNKNISPLSIYVSLDQKTYDALHPDIELQLNELVDKHEINAVIIATEPLVHIMYAKWALSKNLSILMDKPVSTHIGISVNMDSAKKLITDYDELCDLYKQSIKRNPDIVFSLVAQRRYQTSFSLMKGYIKSCFEKTNCPITNVQAFNSDGQWRMPSEIVDQLYHPYMQGYGKCSHSGYHYYDIIPFLLGAGLGNDKYYDNVDVFTTFTRPLDFLEQLTLKDYENIFGKELFWKHNKYDEQQLSLLMKDFGEIDAFSNISFKKGDKVLTVASINLAHNGFAARDWVTAEGRDLYQGNGRVGHESYVLQQGPFQTIHFHSYKSKENCEENNMNSCDVGGKEHVEIYVFKNHKIIGGKPVEKFTIKDIVRMEGDNLGLSRKAKTKSFIEFIKALKKEIKREDMISEFMDQAPAVILTSAIYQSAVAQRNGINPLINLPINLKNKKYKYDK